MRRQRHWIPGTRGFALNCKEGKSHAIKYNVLKHILCLFFIISIKVRSFALLYYFSVSFYVRSPVIKRFFPAWSFLIYRDFVYGTDQLTKKKTYQVISYLSDSTHTKTIRENPLVSSPPPICIIMTMTTAAPTMTASMDLPLVAVMVAVLLLVLGALLGV